MRYRCLSILSLACVLIAVQGAAYIDDTTENQLVNSEGECPSDDWYSSGLSCYYHLEGDLDFYEAMKACSELHDGAQLATFRDQSQYYHIHHIVAHENQHHESKSSGTWIGLMKDREEWHWTDGTLFTYTDFWLQSALLTNGSCGYVPDNKVGYAISPCDYKKAALCEKISEEYTVGEQQRRLKDIFVVSIFMALVVVGGIAVLVIGVSKYCFKYSPKDRGYRKQKDQDSWI